MEALPLKREQRALRAFGLRQSQDDMQPHESKDDVWRSFEQVVRGRHPELRRFAHRVVGDPEAADDALQEAYLKAYRSFPGFRRRDTGSQTGWLFRIVYRCCIDELRRTRRHRSVSIEQTLELAHPGEGPESETVGRMSLHNALADLSPEARAAVLLVDGQGFGYEEAAKILGVPRGTIASRLNTTRTALRAVLADADSQPKTNYRIGG
jgi:RNA polymerase sigma-70 factor, ECF subfamily